LKAKPGRGTLASEKPPIFGMMQRQGEVVIQMLPNVQQVTIAPLITSTIVAGRVVSYKKRKNIIDLVSPQT
jgi:transposase